MTINIVPFYGERKWFLVPTVVIGRGNLFGEFFVLFQWLNFGLEFNQLTKYEPYDDQFPE